MRIGYPASLLLILVTAITPAVAAGQSVSETPGVGTFPLVQAGRAATLVHDPVGQVTPPHVGGAGGWDVALVSSDAARPALSRDGRGRPHALRATRTA